MKNIDQPTKNKMKIGVMIGAILGIIFIGMWIVFPIEKTFDMAFGNGQPTPNIAVIQNDVQEVAIDLQSNAYEPIVVQKGIPVKFNIKATKENINGCNGTLVIPAFNIERTLVPGDNVIEFTPETEGTITYTCWMGMIRSSIQVVSDLDTASVPTNASQGNVGVGASCCNLPQ